MNIPDLPSTLSVSHPAPYRLDAPWSVETRERVTCPDCGQPAFQEPLCRVLDRHGNLLREDRPIVCSACKRNERPKPGQALPRCHCGCGLPARHRRKYRTGHEPVTREEDPMPTDISRDAIITEAKASAAIDQAGPRTALVCPCGCRQPVKPGRKLAGKPCVQRYNRGRKMSPEARANIAAGARKRVERTNGQTGGRVSEPPLAPQSASLIPAGLAFITTDELWASLALHYLRKLASDAARRRVCQLACAMEA